MRGNCQTKVANDENGPVSKSQLDCYVNLFAVWTLPCIFRVSQLTSNNTPLTFSILCLIHEISEMYDSILTFFSISSVVSAYVVHHCSRPPSAPVSSSPSLFFSLSFPLSFISFSCPFAFFYSHHITATISHKAKYHIAIATCLDLDWEVPAEPAFTIATTMLARTTTSQR